MTIRQTLHNVYTLRHLAPLDSELLLSFVLKKPREYLLAYPEKKLTAHQVAKFRKLAKDRMRGKPIAYIISKKEFFGLDFFVNKNVLIPRPETELLVELVLKNIQDTKYLPATLRVAMQAGKIQNTSIIDIGTGSGNIIIAIAKNIPQKMARNMKIFATDISEKALEVARANAKKHKIGKKIKFIQSDLLEYFFKKKLISENLLVVANLPYVLEKTYRKNKKGLIYEPKIALFSRRYGLAYYIRLIREIEELSRDTRLKKILAFLEISPEQKIPLLKIIKGQLSSAKIYFFKDLSKRKRVARVELSKS